MAELESRGQMSRVQVADFLRQFADELDDPHRRGDRETGADRDDDWYDPGEHRDGGSREGSDDLNDGEVGDRDIGRGGEEGHEHIDDPRRVTLVVGGDSATVTLPETVDFDIEVSSRSGMLSSDVTQSIDFYLSWKVEKSEGHDDTIEVV